MLNKFSKNSLPPALNFKIAITVEICRLRIVLVPYYHWAARWGNAQSINTNDPPSPRPPIWVSSYRYGWPSWGAFTWDRDELRPVSVRIGLHTLVFMCLHGTRLKMISDCSDLRLSRWPDTSYFRTDLRSYRSHVKRKRISDRVHK